MSSLPLLSHHLFVAAVGRKERAARPVQRNDLPPLARDDNSPAAPLKILDAAGTMPLDTARPLPGALVLGGS